MNDPSPPVPERFDDMHWTMWVLFAFFASVLVVFWGSVLLAML